jgi:GrpB-like predicted nucleotidyltransferase (UPF0157 family)
VADVTETELLGGIEKRELVVVDHDPAWAVAYADHEARIRAVLGETAIEVEHIGSTSVPGLAAKPIIDVLVTVADITAEHDYLDPLIASGYVLRVREPGHRLVRTPALDVHVHVCRSAPGRPRTTCCCATGCAPTTPTAGSTSRSSASSPLATGPT